MKKKIIEMFIIILGSLIGVLCALSMTLDQLLVVAIVLVAYLIVYFTNWLFYGEEE